MRYEEKFQSVNLSTSCTKCGGIISSDAPTDSESERCICSEQEPAAEKTLNEMPPGQEFSNDAASVEHLFGENYSFLETLGSGGCATVYKVRDETTGQILAAKVMHLKFLNDAKTALRFKQEADSAVQLDHANLVSVRGFGLTSNGAPYILMDYVNGKTLAEILRERDHLSPQQAFSIFTQVAIALEYAHAKGLIHRDIKPSNLLITTKGEDWHVQVVDFGIAKVLADQDSGFHKLTQTGDIFGSPAYMSPEQCVGGAVDVRTDIYALGCVMEEVLTGRNPFYSPSPVKSIVNHLELDRVPFDVEFKHLNIPEKLEKIVETCLNKNPDKRFQSASALAKALQTASNKLQCYPGMLRRSTALVIDFFIFGLLWLYKPDFMDSPYLLALLVIAYTVCFETSRTKGTPGTLIMRMRAVSADGSKQMFLGTLARSSIIVAFFSSFVFLSKASTYLNAIFHHDLGSISRLLLILPIVAALANIVSAHFRKDKRTWLDAQTGRFLIMNKQILLPRTPLPPGAMQKLLRLCPGPAAGVALGVGCFAIFSGDALLHWTMASPGVDVGYVVETKRAITFGEKITKGDLVLIKKLRIEIPEGAVESIDDVVAKRSASDLVSGQMLTQESVQEK
ncbi:hypothetical protein BH10CYA1_BH10CYA1_64810 [soil metagenome]